MSQRSSSLLACLAFVVLATPAMAQSARHKHTKTTSSADIPWKRVYNDATVSVWIDPTETMRRADGTYTTHLRWAYTSDQEIGRNESYRVMRETRLLDCKEVATKPLSANTYDARGKVVSSFTTSDKDIKYMAWTTRKPGSSSANAFQAVCRSLKKS